MAMQSTFNRRKQGKGPGAQQRFRGKIQQFYVVRLDFPTWRPVLIGLQGAVQIYGRNAAFLQFVHLILHQRDQREMTIVNPSKIRAGI